MDIFNFSDFDRESLPLRERNFSLAYKIVASLIIIFFVKFVVVYGYKNYIPLYVFLYFVILISYFIVKKITKNLYLSILSFYMSFLGTYFILLYMSGGIKAPGNLWLSIFPFMGAHLLGRRGFLVGVVLVITALFILLSLASNGIEMYPFLTTESFQKEFRTNLLVFTLSSFYFTYSHVMSEMAFIRELNQVKERNENLLKILFHDLANPMQTIQMLVKKFSNNRTPDDHEKVIQQISKTSQRIVDILEHVRKMKAIEDKKIVLDLKPIPVLKKFLLVKEMFADKLEAKKINFVIQNDNSDEIHVLADQIYFTHQILANVISNAIKFSEENKSIFCSWVQVEENVIITIRDEGIGMPSDILKNLFNPNKQVSRKGTYGEQGTGYGMPLVKTFVEEFGGHIEVSSKEKDDKNNASGTTFSITLKASKL